MRQRGDTTSIDLLNKIRIGYIDDSVESVLKEKFIYLNDSNYSDAYICRECTCKKLQ